MPSSPFLTLPRELRDLIYSYVLVQDADIPIGCGVVSTPNFREIPLCRQFGKPDRGRLRLYSDDYDDSRTVRDTHPLKSVVVSRPTWKIPRSEVCPKIRVAHYYSDEGEFLGPVDPTKLYVEMTYQLDQKPPCRSLGEPIRGGLELELDLSLMRTCRQLYEETCEVFYSQNTFSFFDCCGISTALHFLRDRTLRSLACMRSISLKLHELNPAWPPFLFDMRPRLPQWEVELSESLSCFGNLCRLVASKEMQLRHVELCVRTIGEAHGHPADVDDLAEWLQEEGGAVRLPNWLDYLLIIKDLSTITVRWESSQPRIRRQLRAVSKMRREMLKQARSKTRQDPRNNTEYLVDVKIRCLLRSQGNLGGQPRYRDFAVNYNTMTGEIMLRCCQLRKEGKTIVEDLLGDEDSALVDHEESIRFLVLSFFELNKKEVLLIGQSVHIGRLQMLRNQEVALSPRTVQVVQRRNEPIRRHIALEMEFQKVLAFGDDRQLHQTGRFALVR